MSMATNTSQLDKTSQGSENITATPLHDATESGDVDKVRQLIEQGKYDVNCTDSTGWTPLHYACMVGNLDMVRILVSEFEANVSIQTDEGYTTLMISLACGHDNVLHALLTEYQCPVDAKYKGGRALIHGACEFGNTNLVRFLIREHNADVNAKGIDNNTPLHIAAYKGQEKVALALINEFGCDPSIKGFQGWSLLHSACQGGSVSLVRTLIREHNADVNAKGNDNNTPLHIAALCGQEQVALALINEFGCDPSIKGFQGWSLLHSACQGGSVSLLQTLIQEHNVDINARNNDNGTPLHVAADNGQEEVTLALINEFGCNPSMKDFNGWSVLHSACQGGNISLVRTLIREHNADVNAINHVNDAPLHIAAKNGQETVTQVLINEFGCDPSMKGFKGRSSLHNACQGGCSVCLVQALIQEHSTDVNAKDSDSNTPLHIAALNNREELVSFFINQCGSDPNISGANGKTLLHLMCHTGSASLVKSLVLEHNADINAKDSDNNTPLHIAALHRDEEMVLALTKEFGCEHSISCIYGMSLLQIACQRNFVSLVQFLVQKNNSEDIGDSMDVPNKCKEMSLAVIRFVCDSSFKGYNGGSLLHSAVQWGFTSLIETLIEDHELSLIARDFDNYTPLHLAVLEGQKDIVALLIDKFSCDVNVRASFGESLLHLACKAGHANIVSLLLKHMSNLLLDFNGNTPLHVCSKLGHSECVKALLHVHAPIMIRNNNGKSPVDLATSDCKPIFEKYTEDNKGKIYHHYDVLQEKAKKQYSIPERITRIFVVGNPGVGKSSLIEALKSEDTSRVSESTVPRHTAGIVPSIYQSGICGRVLFYDFAGDPEYYSSHAAILENLASSGKGDNIFVIVFDLREDEEKIESMLDSWLAFINNQNFSNRKPMLIYVGSHVDQVSDDDMEDKEFLFERFDVKFMLDCCQPKSKQICELQSHIYRLTEHSPCYKLSREASILLGLLEKDFDNVMACSVEDFFHHFEDTHVQLPTKLHQLRPFLSELHDIGLLYMIEQKDSLQVVLNTSQLTNKVHQLLFSKAARKKLAKKYKKEPSFSIGIITKTILTEILPEYVSIACLVQLQYCQEISHKEANAFPPLANSSSADQSFLFFPALCSATRSDVLPAPPSCSIGWLARCIDPCNYFPPRFLHVLLLRLVFRFTLSVPKDSPDYDYLKRCCKMWKTGVYWKGKEGVECMVELVRDSKEVLVITNSGEDKAESRIRVLSEIIRCVMEAKADFCHSMTTQCFLLDSTDDSDYLNEDNNLFAMSEVEESLTSPQQDRALLSRTRGREMKVEKLKCLYGLTHWYRFFPLDRVTVLKYLKVVVSQVMDLGMHLKLNPSVLEEIEKDFPSNSDQRRREVVKRWMSSTHTPPCWWNLARALRDSKMGELAAEIERDHRDHIQLQEKLLTVASKSCRPDPEFLQSFAAVVGRDWQSLAASLSLGEGMEKGEDLSPQDHAHRMLKRWASREDATYGHLCTALKAIPLFHYGIK